MGATISFFVEQSIPGAEFNGDGKMLIECVDVLDGIASKSKLGPALSSFFCDPEAMAEDLLEGETIQEPWHDSQPALATVSGLLNALDAQDENALTVIDRGGAMDSLWRVLGIKRGEECQRAETVIQELKELERCLMLASGQTSRFYLLVC